MWTKISDGNGKGYFIKYCHKDDAYVFHLTDFVRIWESTCDRKFLENLLTDQNPLLGGDEASFLDTSIQLLFEGLSDGSTKSTFQIENAGNVRVDLIVSNSSYTLKLPLRFDVAKPETYCKEITIPLVKNVINFQESEDSLICLLNKKDTEISEYKAEGATLSLKHYETKKFDVTNHKERYRSDKSFFQILPDVHNSLNVQLGISPKNTEANNRVKLEIKKTVKLEKNIKIENEPHSPNIELKITKIPSTNTKAGKKRKLNF